MTGSARRQPGLRFLGMAVLWTSWGLTAGLFAAVSLPTIAGLRSFTILSGSMEPTISTGDVVVTRPVSPLSLHVGDVVTFRDPANDERLVTHRVRGIEVGGGVASLETKGDANNTAERWNIVTDGSVGLVSYRVPKLGFLLQWLTRRWPRVLALTLPSMVLGITALVEIWRPSRGPEKVHCRAGVAWRLRSPRRARAT